MIRLTLLKVQWSVLKRATERLIETRAPEIKQRYFPQNLMQYFSFSDLQCFYLFFGFIDIKLCLMFVIILSLLF